MSMGADLSILGLYNNDPTVFDLMVFPDGFTAQDKLTVTDNILVECAELEVLYANPTVMKNVIGIWSHKELPYWQRVYDASQLEYNPIENYRRNETETIEDDRTEQHSGTDTATASGSDALARTGSDTSTDSGTESLGTSGSITNTKTGSDSTSGDSTTEVTYEGTDSTQHDITGYDSNALVPNTKDATTYGKKETTESEADNTTTYGSTNTETLNTTETTNFGKVNTLMHGSTDTTTYGKTDTMQHGEKIEHDGTSERTVLAYGNIGVTTSQEMLTQEMEIAKIINVIPIIIESFKNRFCIMVY